MSHKVPLGGERLGTGKKMMVDLHGYNRSNHNLSYLWRSTMSAGTLVPFLNEVILPGDTFDIDLDCDIKTHPTRGPLFGSFKVQLDTFIVPIRLYIAALHNNQLNIGLEMQNVYLPIVEMASLNIASLDNVPRGDIDNALTNPSSLAAYLGYRGAGVKITSDPEDQHTPRVFNALSILAYWDIVKNYYSNKQEGFGYFIDNTDEWPKVVDITKVEIDGKTPGTGNLAILANGSEIEISYDTTAPNEAPNPNQIYFSTGLNTYSLAQLIPDATFGGTGTDTFVYNSALYGTLNIISWNYSQTPVTPVTKIQLQQYQLSNIDDMRTEILSASHTTPYNVGSFGQAPYNRIIWDPQMADNGDTNFMAFSQQGLAVKTYLSDLFNNWLNNEWIDGAQGINAITAIDTSAGLTMDALNFAEKLYKLLNRVAVSGGSYQDWQEAVYAHRAFVKAETPMYMGGLVKELVFQEVVANAEAQTTEGTQKLGTLAGKGIMGQRHKGGKVVIKADEPSLVMGIISLTPRIDYSQGNKWHNRLQTMDDFHKPGLDEIGFQDLLTEDMHWASTWDDGAEWIMESVGKQPAWINYMTNVNRVYGNFAIQDDEMFMTLNRRYEVGIDDTATVITDLTTYIDPVKYNQIFAYSALDSQNFWAQISVDLFARRVMSAKIMPNL